MTVWNFRDQPLTPRAPAMKTGHVRLRPGFVDENQPPGGDLVLMPLPLAPPPRDVSAVLFAGVQAFF